MSSYDPFAVVPSQHPDDKELVQRKEVLEAIEIIQNYLDDSEIAGKKTLVNLLDDLYEQIEEGDYGEGS